MNKTIFLVRGDKKENYSDFKQRVFLKATEINTSTKPIELKIVLTEHPPPILSIIPFKKKKVATISAKYDTSLSPEHLDRLAIKNNYQVSEAIPVAYSKQWNDGVQTPGICLLTLFKQKTTIEYDTFISIWHNSHTPLSLKIHPLWNYNRNVVENRQADNPEKWDGIVEEHFKNRSDLLNPFDFFGNIFQIIPNMIKVYVDTKSFIDYGTIEPYLATEYYLKS